MAVMLDTVPGSLKPAPTAAAEGREAEGLDPALLRPALAVRDWLLNETAHFEDFGEILPGFADRLSQIGVPLDRITTAIEALHSEYAGVGRFWSREEGYTLRLFPHGIRGEVVYASSPFAEIHRTGEWLLLDVDHTPDERFGIVADLKRDGFKQYLAVPIVFSTGAQNGITFATRTKDGFDARAQSILRFVIPTLAAVMEIRSVNLRLDNVLRIYVGDEPHRAILSGTIRRGDVSRIRSAILFADMRSYTSITSLLRPEEAVQLLNEFFDCLVPPIEAEGGEVLKYLGDGLLAIFRDRGDDTGGTAQAALTAAQHGLDLLGEANGAGRFAMPVEAGVALHYGEAAHGNVGSGTRLDFTVIGPDVNLASRIAELNKALVEPILMSRAFAEHLWGDPEPLGAHKVDGFEDAVTVYRPRR